MDKQQLWCYQMMAVISPDNVERFEYIATPDNAGLVAAYGEAHRRYPDVPTKGIGCLNGGSWSMSRHWNEWAVMA